MNVRAERRGSAAILELEGRLTVEADTHRLHELVRSMARLGACHVVLDLRNVRQLDCSGIGQLVQLHNPVCESGGVFTLVNVERRQRQLLRMAGLLTVFHVLDTRRIPFAPLEASAQEVRGPVNNVLGQAL